MKISKSILLLLLFILIGCRNESFNSEENLSNEILNSKAAESINSDTVKIVKFPAGRLEDDPKTPPRK